MGDVMVQQQPPQVQAQLASIKDSNFPLYQWVKKDLEGRGIQVDALMENDFGQAPIVQPGEVESVIGVQVPVDIDGD